MLLEYGLLLALGLPHPIGQTVPVGRRVHRSVAVHVGRFGNVSDFLGDDLAVGYRLDDLLIARFVEVLRRFLLG